MRKITIVNGTATIHIIKDNKLKKTFKGIAKCFPTDEWNDELGLKFASYRAMNQRDAYKIQVLEGRLRETYTLIQTLQDRIDERKNELKVLHY